MQLDRHQVVTGCEQQDEVERDERHADAGARRVVARAVEQVVLLGVTGDPALQERVETHRGPHQWDEQHGADHHVEAVGVAQQVEFEPAR